MTDAWHARSTDEVLGALASDLTAGLGTDEARRRLAVDGPNSIRAGRELRPLDILIGQFRQLTVYARVTAEHKLRIVRAWKANGAVVAMTGDGVNDAPALKEASIGIAMGITGTEVSLKTLGYLVAGNASELTLMLVVGLLGWPLPLLPIQLLWVNLVTDGFPALTLASRASCCSSRPWC